MKSIFTAAMLVLIGLLILGSVFSVHRVQDESQKEKERLRQEERARRVREREAREEERLRRIEQDRWQLAYQLHEAEERACCKRYEMVCREFEIRELFADQEFIGNYARKKKDVLIRDAARIMDRYHALHEDVRVVERLKRERPEIYERALWEVRALNLAQRFDVEPLKAPLTFLPAPVALPKRKPSPEEFRERMVRREQTRSWDKIEKSRTRIEGIIQARKMLDEFDLDPDERVRLEAEVVGEIVDDGDPNNPNTL